MFGYPYTAIDNPNLNLLSSVSCPFDEPIYATSPFLLDAAFPTSSSLPSPSNYFVHRRGTAIPDRTTLFSSSARDFNRPEPVRRVYSAGDLRGMNCAQEGAAAASTGRVGRYTAEERKERIERYRSKRSQRNFHKKITYNCRKTLADSRPRVKGRFARNGETEIDIEAESSEAGSGFYRYDACVNNGFDGSDDGKDWLKQMQAALAEEKCRYEDDIWTGLDSVFAVNLLS